MNISKLEVFSYPFLQDAFNLMRMMDREGITKEDFQDYVEKSKSEMREVPVKKKRIQYGKAQGNPRPFEDKGKPCTGCKDKKKEEIK